MTTSLTRGDYILMILAWISISVSSILVLLSGATSLQAAFWRVLLGAVITMILSKGVYLKSFTRAIHVASGVLLGLHFLTWMESLFHVPVAVSTTLVVLYPVFLLIFDYIILKEPIGKRQVLGMIIAFLGVVVMMAPGFAGRSEQDWEMGSILALVGALAAAGYFGLGRIARKKGTSLSEYTINVYLWAAVSIAVYAVTVQATLIPRHASSWPYLVLLAIIPMLGGHSVMNYLLKKTSSSTVTSIALGEPAGATLLAWLILSQIPPIVTIIGMIVTLKGILLATVGMRPSKKI